MERIVDRKTICLRRLGEGRRDEMCFGRFLHNPRVTLEEMLATTAAAVRLPVADRHVLAIQDTTEVNYQARARRTHGLGTVGNGRDCGFFLHPVLVVDAAHGGVLGLAGAQLWNRTTGKAANYRQLPIELKESSRWLAGAELAQEALLGAALVTIVADRESDIYDEFARIPDAHTHLVTRVCRDRALAEGAALYPFTDALPERHRYRLALPALRHRPPRLATMALRFAAVEIRRPAACPDKSLAPMLRLHVVDVREVDPPPEQPAVHWRLLTTHPVADVGMAMQVVAWYCRRWIIEQLFRTLKKQGLDIEGSQVEDADALMKLTVIALIAATRTLQLVLARDGTTEQSASEAFAEPAIEVIARLQPQLEGKTAKQKNPYPPRSLAWAAWTIARLGGWNGYASERPPGPITMHHGLQRFDAIVQGFHLRPDVCMP